MELIYLVFLSSILLGLISIYSSVFGLTLHDGIFFIFLAILINAGKIFFCFLFHQKWYSFKKFQKQILSIVCGSFIFLSIYGSYSFISNELGQSISKEEQIVSQLFNLEKKQEQLLDKINHLSTKESTLKQKLNLESTELDKQIYELKNRTILDNLEAGAIISFSKSWNFSISDTAKYISIILAVTLDPLAILLLLLGFYLQQKSIWPLKKYFLNKGIKTTFPSLIDGLPPYIQDNLIYDGQKYFSITPIKNFGKYFVPKILISGNIKNTAIINNGNFQLINFVSHGTKFVYNFVAPGSKIFKINSFSGKKHNFIMSKNGIKSNIYNPIQNGLVIKTININKGEMISPKIIQQGTNSFIKLPKLNMGKLTPISLITHGEKIINGIINNGNVKNIMHVSDGNIMNKLILVSSGNKLKLNRISIKGKRPKLNNSIFPGTLISNIKSENRLFSGTRSITPLIQKGLMADTIHIKNGLRPFISKEFIPVEHTIEKEKTAFEIEHGMTEEEHYEMMWERPGDYLTDYEKGYGK